ncbi:MAG TPA: MDR family MFS transporter [Thermoanaerobaculia bacterium]|nr:MDR family MFS transporter [Thermoanaerobaculia bacterium]
MSAANPSRPGRDLPVPPLDPGRRRWILMALMATVMLAAMDTTIVSTAIPQIVADLGDFSLFSWVFSIYLLAQTVTIPVYGKIADLVGRKPVLVGGILVFLAGSVTSAFAWSMVTLIVFRGLQGLGAGSIMATVNTLAGDLYTVRERARIQGWLSSVWGVAAILGPTLGGAFVEYASWPWIFLVNLPVGAVALPLLIRFLHEEAVPERHRIDWAGALLTLLAGGTLVFGLLEGGQAWPWLSRQSAFVFTLAALLAAATVWVERRAAEPIMPPWLWRHRTLAGSNLAMIGMGIVLMAPTTFLPTFGQAVLGLGAITAGLLLAGMSIGWPVASSLSGRFYLRTGFRDVGLAGAVLVVLAVGAFLLVTYPGRLLPLFAGQLLLGAGFGLLSTPLLVGGQSTVTWHQRGVVTSANIFSRYLGQSLGAALFGAAFNHTLAQRLTTAPEAIRAVLPADVDSVVGALAGQGEPLPGAAMEYLRRALWAATRHVYAGALAVALLTVVVVALIPRRFPAAGESGRPAPGVPPDLGALGH